MVKHPHVKVFYFLSCPWSFAEKFQTGTDAGVVGEAFYADMDSHFGPAHVFYKVLENCLERDAVKRVV